jgi:sugar phosphate isomerase/epimerase
MEYSICSYSFHRTFPAGKMDIFRYITWNQEHGFTQLDPWMKHLEEGYADNAYLAKVKDAAAEAGLPFGCIAVDGAHIYEPTEEARQDNRARAYRWIDIAQFLGAPQVRIDAGGPEEMPDDVFAVIVEGYRDVIAYAKERGVEVIVENHWGPTKHARNVVKLLEAVEDLGLLFDTYNWAPGTHEEAWNLCARYARLTHIKTREFDEQGNDRLTGAAKAIQILRESGYQGVWGIESVPVNEEDEVDTALKTLALIKRELGQPA